MNDIESLGMRGSGGSKMPHSHSTPAGVDGGSRTPPTTPRKAGKMLAVRVQMLDDTITMFQVQAKALGRVLFDQVCKQLHLLEADYFGLEYQEPNGTKYWLDLEKPVCRQVGLSLVDPLLRFCVKFYTPDPAQLEEEFTRYLFCLQIKRDLAQGLLQCNDNTAALMASYIVQAECGDYVIEDYPDHTYLSTYKFVPHQDQEFERRIMENHKKHAGQSPAEADLNLLETARRCELYGMKMHPAKDHEGVSLNLAVAHMGIVVFQNYTKINTFSWAKIRKISFKRKRFLIKLHPEGYGYYKDTVEFFFEGRNECKNFWKKCVENHGFFRCSVVKRVVRQKTRVLSRGSSFRYSGKTQKQIVEFVRDNYVKRQTFQRSNSFRQTSGGRALQGSEGGGYRGATSSSSLMGSSSISAHPLLPLGDPALETPALSLSCGSMTLDSPTTVTSVSMGGTNHHRREDTATSFRTLTSIDVHSPATPNSQVPAQRQTHAISQQRISSAGRISPSNSSPPEFPPPRPLPRHPWQRSVSCRELYASNFEDSGKARPKEEKPINETPLEPFQLPSQGELDNPVTRYDESHRSYSAASSKLPSLDHDSVPERVYSSSYPGTSSLSTESGHEESGPAGDLSHDDLSHDSYELLEREQEFEYPDSYSSPCDENEPISDNSDEGIEHEMFQMDSETDSFVKHRSVKSTDKQHFKAVLADIKNSKSKSIDRYSAAFKSDGDYILTESRIHRSNTQIERKFEQRHANSIDLPPKVPVSQDASKKQDPVVLQAQKQKMVLLNEIKSLKPKYKITHVDSEVLRDEGIMRPKSRIDDDLSPVDTYSATQTIPGRTSRARSIASLEDSSSRHCTETGSLGRGHKSREKKAREADVKVEKILSKLHEKERRSIEKEERKRSEREMRRLEKADSRERRSVDRLDSLTSVESHGRHGNGSRELRRSVERLDSRERSHENLESKPPISSRVDFRETRGKSAEGLDSYEKTRKNSDQSYRFHDKQERRESREIRRSSVRSLTDYERRHTLERFDSGNTSPSVRGRSRDVRRKSVEALDAQIMPTFDFDPNAIEHMRSLDRDAVERLDARDGSYEKKLEYRTSERKSLDKMSSRERKSLDRLDSRERRSFECLDRYSLDSKGSSERLEYRESRKHNRKPERGRSEEKPRERDDWRSLEKARKDDERRERERQARLSLESRTETVIGVPNERDKTKAVFTEYEPKVVGGVIVGFDDSSLATHVPVERTKSDPNPSRQRLGSNSKRHVLMHQKSIDLTPADSGDEDPFSSGGTTHKTTSDIPYTLHKRHVMNGTASDEKSESDSGKTTKTTKAFPKDLLNLPLKVTDVSCLDLTKLSIDKPKVKVVSPEKLKGILISPDKPKSILSPSDKPKSILSPTSKLSPTDHKTLVSSLSETSPRTGSTRAQKGEKVCSKSLSGEKRSPKLSPTEPSVTIISAIPKKSPQRSLTDPNMDVVSVIEKRKLSNAERTQSKEKVALNFAEIVGLEMKQELDRREKEKLTLPDDALEKQDSIEQIPLPEIPVKHVEKKQSLSLHEEIVEAIAARKSLELKEPKSAEENVQKEPKTLEKPSIPEKTKRILDKIESRFSEINKTSATKIARPKIIDTGYDDFVEPVADLPLDEVPVKPAPELDSLKVPEFLPFMLRPHAEPIRSKSLSLAEEKAPIDTLLSPEMENKHFVQDVSPKKGKKTKTEVKKDFKKQSKSLEGDKPPLKKAGSKESKISPASSKIDKSKLKLGEMPQEIIIIDSTDVVPEVSIVQKGRSKSATRLCDKSFSTSKDDKEESKSSKTKSASVDEDLMKGSGVLKTDKQRPKSLGISKSLGSTEREDSVDKVSPKRSVRSSSRIEVTLKTTPTVAEKSVEAKVEAAMEQPSVPKVPKETKPSKEEKVDKKSDEDLPPEAKAKAAAEKKRDKVTPTSQDLTDSTLVLRKPGQTPILFARARLGLSEGSAIGTLQRQGATQSPTSQRRAKSLDAPVISVHRLPPANAFSSKDDTVDVKEENEPVEEQVSANGDANGTSKPAKPMTLEVSPNHKSDSTDHTTVPEICTDSLSVTETSAQYLESPLTECNEIVICPDLIPYEQDAQLQFSPEKVEDEASQVAKVKLDRETKFIDQSSVESATDQDVGYDSGASRMPLMRGDERRVNNFSVKIVSKFVQAVTDSKKPRGPRSEWSSGNESSDGEQQRFIYTTGYASDAPGGASGDKVESRQEKEGFDPEKRLQVKEDVPSVTVSPVPNEREMNLDEPPGMVKSPVQISIEECSDNELENSDEQEEETPKPDLIPQQEERQDKRRLDSGDTSEDTLDACDMHMQSVDSELSSPDYGMEKVDEKTLVEVELTPEYLEMKKEQSKESEAPAEDEPSKDRGAENEADNNRLSIDRKLRLSTERSRSEETNTWTPDREDPDSSSCSIARPLGIGQIQPIIDRREINLIRESRREGSFEESSSGQKPELSSTWKPFPLESSGSSSLEEGWMPQDDNNYHQSQSEESNGQNEDSFQEELGDFPGTFAYTVGPEILASYGAFSLSRTLSRISERSTTSEQDKSDLEDSFKPSSRSPSLDDESLMSSDHQPSLSSDPPSGTALPSVSDDRRTSSELPDIPIDVVGQQEDADTRSPRSRRSRLHLQTSEDWPSPPSSPLFDTPVVSHVETFYMEIKPEEAVKVTVTDSTETSHSRVDHDSDSSDENRTLHDDLHSTLLEDGQSSASATTVDGTVKIAVKVKSNSHITGSSHSEDTSMGLSMSEWSSSNNTVRQFCQYSGTKSDDNSLAELGASISDWSGSTTMIPQQYYSAAPTEKSQSDTTTSDKSVTSMRPNSKCQFTESPPPCAEAGALGGRSESSGGSSSRQRYEDGGAEEPREIATPQSKDEFDEARKFVESQFDEHRRYFDEEQGAHSVLYPDIEPPQVSFHSEFEEIIEEEDFQMIGHHDLSDIPLPIPEEDEEDQLYDNVPAMKYPSGDQTRMEVSRGDSSEDMHEKYATNLRTRSAEDDWSFEEQKLSADDEKLPPGARKVVRGYSEPASFQRLGTKSTERPVVIPIKARSTPYYSTTSLSGESTTSSPPMQIRAQIRTKTLPYSSSRSPQSEGDTSSSMDSPAHTPDRGQRAFRRKRQQNVKRRHRVSVDLEVKDGHIVSSTDSSFDVASIPPPLLPEQSIDVGDEDDNDDLSGYKGNDRQGGH